MSRPSDGSALGPSGAGAIDRAFARLVGRLAGGDPLLVRTARLASRERGRGHACLDLASWAGRPERPEAAALPPLGAWRDALAASPLVAIEGSGVTQSLRPFVLDGDRLYLLRYWRAERRLAARVLELSTRERATIRGEPIDVGALRPRVAALFPAVAEGGPSLDGPDRQALAAATALWNPLTVVSGGPGTGKTTTVAAILALLLSARPSLRVALAAPTGKAATRLAEAIGERVADLVASNAFAGTADDDGAAILERLPRSASTLHRLLAYDPRDDRFGRHADEPLTADLVVVDEASMVDLLMMDALFAALGPGARLVLLGDKDQLASVEAGFVFGDLCAAGGVEDPAPSPAFVDFRGGLGIEPPPLQSPPPSPASSPSAPALPDTGVALVKSYRFDGTGGIGALADAIRRGDADAALAVLADPGAPEVVLHEHPLDPTHVLDAVGDALDSVLIAGDPVEALRRLAAIRLLCLRRRGPWSVADLGARVERRLAAAGLVPGDAAFYRGRPILVEANDYAVGLFNGDLGVCWTDPSEAGDALWAFFPGDGSDGALRRIPLAKLPTHATAWAMTVHKSQGSELDRVLLALPADDHPLATRELLYTGVTRARHRVDLVASPALLRAALARSSRRASGLVDALRTARGRSLDSTAL